MNRNLDGMYFRVFRDSKWQNICFSDLTHEEINTIGTGRSAAWWKAVAINLADTLKAIGNMCDLYGGFENTDDEELVEYY